MNSSSTKTKYVRQNSSVMGHFAKDDGVTHINIHTRGKTALGTKLSHFAHTPFTHPHFGPFYSMEGLWYYLRARHAKTLEDEKALERMRYLSGFRAKNYGKMLPYGWYADFKEDIMAANYQKIIQTPGLQEMIIESSLPFDHYYTFGDIDLHVTPNNYDWLCEGFEQIRSALKDDVVPKCWVSAEARYAAA